MIQGAATDLSEPLIISPELALVDPELAALARAAGPDPFWLPAAEPALELAPDPPPAETVSRRRGFDAYRPLVLLLFVSVVLNAVGLRYLWDDGVSPKDVLSSRSSAPPTTRGIGGVLGAQFPHSSVAPTLKTPRPSALPSPAITPAKTQPLMTATDVQVRLLTRLGTKPLLRQRFLDAAGIPLPGVSDRCTRVASPRSTVAAFRCVVWRQPASIKSGTPVQVRIGGGRSLRLTAVG